MLIPAQTRVWVCKVSIVCNWDSRQSNEHELAFLSSPSGLAVLCQASRKWVVAKFIRDSACPTDVLSDQDFLLTPPRLSHVCGLTLCLLGLGHCTESAKARGRRKGGGGRYVSVTSRTNEDSTFYIVFILNCIKLCVRPSRLVIKMFNIQQANYINKRSTSVQ